MPPKIELTERERPEKDGFNYENACDSLDIQLIEVADDFPNTVYEGTIRLWASVHRPHSIQYRFSLTHLNLNPESTRLESVRTKVNELLSGRLDYLLEQKKSLVESLDGTIHETDVLKKLSFEIDEIEGELFIVKQVLRSPAPHAGEKTPV